MLVLLINKSYKLKKKEMPILCFVNCERTVLFSVKRDLDVVLHTEYRDYEQSAF